jgi:hypothetical protein
MFWVRKQFIVTERQSLVGEVSANICGWRVPRGERDGFLRPYSLFFYTEAATIYSK